MTAKARISSSRSRHIPITLSNEEPASGKPPALHFSRTYTHSPTHTRAHADTRTHTRTHTHKPDTGISCKISPVAGGQAETRTSPILLLDEPFAAVISACRLSNYQHLRSRPTRKCRSQWTLVGVRSQITYLARVIALAHHLVHRLGDHKPSYSCGAQEHGNDGVGRHLGIEIETISMSFRMRARRYSVFSNGLRQDPTESETEMR